MEKVSNKSVQTDNEKRQFNFISFRMKLNEIKELAALLKKPVSGAKLAVMERIREALCDPEYIVKIKKELDLSKITEILSMGLRVREMEKALKIQYDISHVLLVAYEEAAVREQRIKLWEKTKTLTSF